MEQIASFFKGKTVRSILDVGTGPGKFIRLLMPLFPDAEITGIDPSEEALVEARANIRDCRATFLKMNAEELHFADGGFGLVTMSNALHHLPSIKKSLNEIKRVAGTNGYIVISELYSDNLNPAQENQKFFHHIKSQVDRLNGIYHHETWKKEEILGMIQQNGIQIETAFDYSAGKSLITEAETEEAWVFRLGKLIEAIKGKPEYATLLPKVGEFGERIKKYGMQQATNVVAIGKVKR